MWVVDANRLRRGALGGPAHTMMWLALIVCVANCSTSPPAAEPGPPEPKTAASPTSTDATPKRARASIVTDPRLVYAHGHGCVRTNEGLVCWGQNDYGSLGADSDDCGAQRCWRTPRALGGAPVDEVALGWRHLCVRRGGSVACRGSNDMLQVGHRVDGTCRVTMAGEGRCKFDLETGQVHDCEEVAPASVKSFPCASELVEIHAENAAWVRASDFATCIGTSDATLCAGYGFGDLARDLPIQCGPFGDEPCAAIPHALDVGATASVFAGQNGRWCALTPAGTLRCGPALDQLAGTDDVVAFTVGRPACALRSDATLWCEGDDALAKVLDDVVDVATDTHACAVTGDGGLWCWGSNEAGQLGLGDRKAREQPTRLELPDMVEVEVGYERSCALSRDGTLWCWGSDEGGALGIGDGPRARCQSAGIGVGPVPCVLEPRRVGL